MNVVSRSDLDIGEKRMKARYVLERSRKGKVNLKASRTNPKGVVEFDNAGREREWR